MAEPRASLAERLDRHHAALVAATLFAAFVLRALVLIDLRKTIYARELAPDEDTYDKWARRLLDGSATADFAPDFPRLPAAVFSWVYRIFGADVLYLRALNLLLGVAICALAYACGRALYGKRVGLLAALLCAWSKSLVFYSVTALHTNLGLTLIGIAFCAAIASSLAAARLRAPALLVLGAACGLLVNVRANAALLALLAVPPLVAIAREGARARVAAAKLAASFVAAYALCAALSGGIRGPAAGFNLYLGNNSENPTPYFRPVRFTSSAPERQALGFTIEASRRAGQDLTRSEAELFFACTVLADALAAPASALARFARKLHALVHASPSDNNQDPRVAGAELPTLAAACLPSWLLIALGVAAALALPLDRRLALGAGAFALYALSVVAFFAGERLRVPLVLLSAPYAAAGLERLAASRPLSSARSAALRAGLGLGALGVLAHAPLSGADDLSAALNMRALMAFDAGDLAAAERGYRRSLALKGLDSDGARIGLAAILQRQQRVDDAVAMLELVPDDYYEAASKYEWIGNLELARRRLPAAQSAYAAAIEIDSSRVNAYQGLYIALRLKGDVAAAAAVDRRLARVRAFDTRASE
jgi:4-amino-4-deoxy-L-arabinose transferase-like glycosyltransferase